MHKTSFMRPALLLALASALGACALTTPPAADELYRQALPAAPLPGQWQAAAIGAVVPGWLDQYQDPQLSALVAEALLNNPDLKVVASRVEQAAAYARVAGSSLLPQVNFIAKDGLAQSGGDGSGISVVGLFASWELDLWGRVRGGREFASQQYASAVSDAEYARQSLVALVTKSYLQAIEAGQQKQLARKMQESSAHLLKYAEERQRIGRGDGLEVAQAQVALQGYLDAVQQLALAETQAVRALEVALGRYPGQSLKLPAQLPQVAGDIPAGLPSELLERRPDVIAAQRRVAAAFARVDEAKAARLPRLSLTANVNAISSDVFLLKERDNPVWGLGASLLAPIFTGGALQGQVEVRSAEQKQAVAEYAKVGARAFAEVENALSAEISARKRTAILTRSAAENQRALDLAGVRVKVGSGDMRALQQQQLATYAAQSALLRMQSEFLMQRTNAYLALGGGFESPAADAAGKS
ncbi:efflux transporter outer membrane subunit [Uliginosibacterium sp. TH139]|uniref:efflux transporter outer membrane subunit n=1 Tax=Uliginosibacterium sp. TH139 TaxID=2067453 RepID=UPI000C7A7DC8|nr:TolC family protein [Uliginosibacterium sp. TH139]PLK49592.1 RND transporter [Uliginosibacterium sp. TH139]